jgi:hypothetical protein
MEVGLIPFRQEIRFARTNDELRIAYAISGQGYPLVRAATWMCNVEFDWRMTVFGPLFRELSATVPLEQLRTDLLFQTLHLQAHGRLAQVNTCARACEPAMVGDRHECPQKTGIQISRPHHSLPLSM